MKYCLSIYLFLLLLSVLSAQDLTPVIYQQGNVQLQQLQQGKANAAYLTQIGYQNSSSIVQNGGDIFVPNLVRVQQNGTINAVSIAQNGSLNHTDASQTGQRNYLQSAISGNQNTTLVTQNGEANTVQQNIRNADRIRSEFIQNGNFNHVEQTIENVSDRQFILTQNGNSMHAVIIQKGG